MEGEVEEPNYSTVVQCTKSVKGVTLVAKEVEQLGAATAGPARQGLARLMPSTSTRNNFMKI